MGGKSSTEQTQQSQSEPWKPAQPVLQGILGQLQGQLGNTGLTANETGALDAITANAQQGNRFAGDISGVASELLGGGGAGAQIPGLEAAYADYQRRLNPVADGQNIGPNGNPALKGYLDTIGNDVQNRVNGMFAGAGRDFSGANLQTLGRGIAEGTAPILAQQYNTDFNNMRSAADALYGGANTTGGLIAGLNQQGLTNKIAGIGASTDALNAQNAGSNAILQAEAQRRGIPVQALGLLAQIGVPIAGLGGQSTSTSKGSQTMSGADQFYKIASGIGALMPKAPVSFG